MIKGQNFIGGGGRLHDAADYTGAERERVAAAIYRVCCWYWTSGALIKVLNY
jgi:hypothetical protein